MKWLQKKNKSDATTGSPVTAGSFHVEMKTTAAANHNHDGTPVASDDDASEHTQKSAVPDEILGETTSAPITEASGRPARPARRQSRTVASPIPAMLAESMSLAEEPPPSFPPKINHFKASNRQ